MAQAMLNVRIDGEDKKEFEQFCKSVGINVSAAVNMFVKATLRERKIPFEIGIDPFYSQENIERLLSAKAQLEAGRGTEHELLEVDE